MVNKNIRDIEDKVEHMKSVDYDPCGKIAKMREEYLADRPFTCEKRIIHTRAIECVYFGWALKEKRPSGA